MSAVQTLAKSALGKVKSTRYENPVVTREVRTRMRGAKAYLLMAAYVVILGIVLLIQYYSQWIDYQNSFNPASWRFARLGFSMFSTMTWIQAILIALVAPAVTAGSITIEREQQTIELLALTPLSARNIVAGKVMSAMLFVSMLLGCSLPLAGICIMLGSISPLEIAMAYLMLMGWALLFASIGVFFSSVLKKTVSAYLVTFAVVVAYSLTNLILTMDLQQYGYRHSSSTWQYVFAGLNAMTAADYAVSSASVLGLNLPIAAVALLMEAGLATLLILLAASNQPFKQYRKPALIRSLMLGVTVAGFFLFFANIIDCPQGFSSSEAGEFAALMMGTLSVLIMAAIPALCTGPLRTKHIFNDVFLGTVRGKFFALRPAGGLWFVASWFILGCLAVTLVMALHDTTASRGYGMTHLPDWGLLIQSFAALLAAVAGMGCIGIMLSSILKSRQWAAGLSILFNICAWCVFMVMMGQYASSNSSWQGSGWQYTTGPQWGLAYLWPVLSLSALQGDWRQGENAPQLPISGDYAWVGCIVAWTIVGLVALLISNRYIRQGKGIQDE